jgi:hypothetical protein
MRGVYEMNDHPPVVWVGFHSVESDRYKAVIVWVIVWAIDPRLSFYKHHFLAGVGGACEWDRLSIPRTNWWCTRRTTRSSSTAGEFQLQPTAFRAIQTSLYALAVRLWTPIFPRNAHCFFAWRPAALGVQWGTGVALQCHGPDQRRMS